MLRNYLLIALRHLNRERLYALINVLGLSIGIGCCLLIFLLVRHESSYDSFHNEASQLYQISTIDYMPKLDGRTDEPEIGPLVPMAMPQVIKEEIPEVAAATAWNGRRVTLRYEDELFREIADFAHPDFFQMFSFEVLAGSRQALGEPIDLVISQKVASKLFGSSDPIGKVVEVRVGEKSYPLTVRTLLADPPTNTNLLFNVLLPIQLMPYYQENYPEWNNRNTNLLVKLEKGVSQAQFEEKLAGFYEVHWGEDDQNKRESLELGDETVLGGLVTTPLTQLHLSPDIGWSRSINPQYGVILSAIAFLILIIATINYVSLAMARANRRLREVGVRKTLGAHSGQIMVQFLGEAILLAMLAMVLAAAWVELALPFFDQLIGHEMEVSLLDQPQFLLGLIGLSILVGVLAGSYPAFFLGRFSPASVLKSHQQFKVRTGFTKALVVLQYSLTLFLIVSSMLMNRQMTYISEKDLGFNQDQIVAVPMGTGWSEAGERLYYQMKGALESHPDIHKISSTSLSFGHGWSRFSSSFEGKSFYAYAFRVDPQYIPSLEIELKAGENFMPTKLIDTSNIIINETLAKQLDTDDPVGKNIPIFGTRPGPRVIGVVKDYHIFSLDQPIQPVVLHMDSAKEKLNYLYFKVSPTRQAETVTAIRESFEQFQHNVPFQHYYLDEDLATQYEAHRRRTRLMQIATLFAILIACLGLFALASLNASNRTKEIGIRKVFGADLGRLLLLLNKEVLLLALLAFAIGAPSAAYFMQEWLDQFLFKTNIDWSLFVFALGIAVGLALLTVSYQVIRVAMTRPSEALRHE